MADKTSNGASGRSDLDPFAELTRIMGFDPRLPVEESAPSALLEQAASERPTEAAKENFSVEDSISAAELNAEDFGIDLEQELLGALSDEDAADAGGDGGSTSRIVETTASMEATDDDPTVDAPELDMQEIEDEISKHVDAFMEADRADDIKVAAEALTPWTALVDPETSAVDDRAEAIPAQDLSEFDIEKSLEEAFATSNENSDEANERQSVADPDWEPAPFLVSKLSGADTRADAMMADVDMDFGDEAAVGPESDGTASAQPDAAELEAEYNALLGNNSTVPMAAHAGSLSVHRSNDAEQRAASIVAGTWRKSATHEPEPDDEAVAVAVQDNSAAEASMPEGWHLAADSPAVISASKAELGHEQNEVAPETLDAELFDALAEAAAEVDPSEPQVAAVAKPEPTPQDPFAALAAMAAKYQTGPQESTWRETASRYETPRAAAQEPVQPTYARPVAPTIASRPVAPEIETVDVQDDAVALADDLNLPDIAYDEAPARRYDDLDAEFNNLLSEMSSGERREPAAPAYAPIHRQPAYVEQRTPPQPQRTVQAAAPAPARYEEDPYDAVSDRDFEDAMAAFEADAEDDEVLGAPTAPMVERRPRRGLYIAAIVGGLALIGGIGAVAMSFGGSNDASEIALVKADGKPIKVRPENPGGSTVPNQDSSVYDSVSRSGSTEAPTQERLVNTAEEPLDLPVPNDEEVVDDVASIAKGEDRVEQVDEPDALANQETIAVAPRKVRTMVVKSDGTLVPREEPAAEVETELETAPATAPSLAASEEEPGTEQITTGATKPSVTPAQAEQEVAALAQPEKPVAPATGAWSVQVSSQPSEDGANQSLKSISRKYAGVIGDRGGNVVKAEVDGKGTMWRVRIPAGSRDDAISLCSDLKAAGGSCFVTK